MNRRTVALASAYGATCLALALTATIIAGDGPEAAQAAWNAAHLITVTAGKAAMWALPVLIIGMAAAWFLTSPWDEDTDTHWDDEL